MRLLDWGVQVDQAGYEPTMFDELVVVLGGKHYEIVTMRVLVPGGEEGPGVVEIVAGEPIPGLDQEPGGDHERVAGDAQEV